MSAAVLSRLRAPIRIAHLLDRQAGVVEAATGPVAQRRGPHVRLLGQPGQGRAPRRRRCRPRTGRRARPAPPGRGRSAAWPGWRGVRPAARAGGPRSRSPSPSARPAAGHDGGCRAAAPTGARVGRRRRRPGPRRSRWSPRWSLPAPSITARCSDRPPASPSRERRPAQRDLEIGERPGRGVGAGRQPQVQGRVADG